jgi:glycosyltransferase involved in cell wall biosynthesis
VFFVSEWSRQVISRAVGLALDKSCVIPLGVSDRFRAANGAAPAAHGAGRPDVLVVGSIASHRDHLTVFEAWARVLARHGTRRRLVVVGPVLEPAHGDRVRRAASRLEPNGAVAFLDETPREELVRLYQSAAVLVLPSSVESFGLPLLEAMACGSAVIASDIPVAREVCGDGAWYYRPGDPADLAEKLDRLLVDARARESLADAGSARARRFPWGRTAGLTLRLLKGIPVQAGTGTSVKAGVM